MGVDGIGEVGDWASERQSVGVYWGRFNSRVSGRERSQGWDEEDGVQA